MQQRIAALSEGLARLHVSPWIGVIEEVGTGSWIQALIQSEPGASATLWAGRSSYARRAQDLLYGTQSRSVARQTVEHWALSNLQSAPELTHFYSLAISGALASPLQQGDDHAWLALATRDGRGLSLHLRCCEPERLAQQLSLGELGVRLLTQLVAQTFKPEPLLNVLSDQLGLALEIDVWQSWEPESKSRSEARSYTCALEAIDLLLSGASPLVLLQPEQGQLKPVRYLDLLRGRRLLLHKGSFNPVTRAHLAMPDQVLAHDPDLLPVIELSLSNADKALGSRENLAHRLCMLALASPWPIALTLTPALYQTRELFSERAQAAQVDFVCGEDLYRRVFLSRYYQALDGGIDEGLRRLFADSTRLWVCGRETELDFPEQAKARSAKWQDRIQFLELARPEASSSVREALAAGQTGWQSQLDPAVARYIQQQVVYPLPS